MDIVVVVGIMVVLFIATRITKKVVRIALIAVCFLILAGIAGKYGVILIGV